MALYKDFTIEGGTVTLNMDYAGDAVVHTPNSVWYGITGSAVKISIVDGKPVWEFDQLGKSEQKNPEVVTVKLSGDKWLVDMAGEVIDQIHEQSKHGRVVIKRDE